MGLLRPAVLLQHELRRKCLGHKFWQKQMRRLRKKLEGTGAASLQELYDDTLVATEGLSFNQIAEAERLARLKALGIDDENFPSNRKKKAAKAGEEDDDSDDGMELDPDDPESVKRYYDAKVQRAIDRGDNADLFDLEKVSGECGGEGGVLRSR